MYVMYYASMPRCWQLIRILVRTNHPYLSVRRHKAQKGLGRHQLAGANSH
jgi:hypothetical protein